MQIKKKERKNKDRYHQIKNSNFMKKTKPKAHSLKVSIILIKFLLTGLSMSINLSISCFLSS